MQNIAAALRNLEDRGLQVWAEDGRIRYRGPRHPENIADLARLKAHETETLLLLEARDANIGGPGPDRPSTRPERIPLTVTQRSWFRPEAFDAFPAEYRKTPNLTVLFGALNPDRLEAAIRQVIQRHEILRTRYDWDGAERWQEILPEARVALTSIDLKGLPQDEQHDRILETVRAAFREPPKYDLGAPVQAFLFSVETQAHVLALVVDHIVLDNRSMEIIVRSTFEHYFAIEEGREPNLPPLKIQYADYALKVEPLQSEQRLKLNAERWRDKMGGAQPLNLRRGMPAGGAIPSPSGSAPIFVHENVRLALKAWSRTQGFTSPMCLLAATAALLSLRTGQGKVVMGCLIDGRPAKMADNAGAFIRTSPLVIDLSDDPSLAELMKRSRVAYLEACDPELAILAEDIPGLAQVNLNMQKQKAPYRGQRRKGPSAISNGFAAALAASTQRSRPLAEDSGTSAAPMVKGRPSLRILPWRPRKPLNTSLSLDFQIFMIERPNMIHGHVRYAADRVPHEDAWWFASRFQLAVAQIVSDSERRLSALRLDRPGAPPPTDMREDFMDEGMQVLLDDQ